MHKNVFRFRFKQAQIQINTGRWKHAIEFPTSVQLNSILKKDNLFKTKVTYLKKNKINGNISNKQIMQIMQK